mmetsp:Transcript_29377/g.82848  ORF Transcript_29377/g.82848 Transcript_29377/m.82848 type:complete len:99 (-) Transcript_29377:950-1246(-)
MCIQHVQARPPAQPVDVQVGNWLSSSATRKPGRAELTGLVALACRSTDAELCKAPATAQLPIHPLQPKPLGCRLWLDVSTKHWRNSDGSGLYKHARLF